jgi:hypothetical protein
MLPSAVTDVKVALAALWADGLPGIIPGRLGTLLMGLAVGKDRNRVLIGGREIEL